MGAGHRSGFVVPAVGPSGDAWAVLAGVLFLHSVAVDGGPDHPTVRRNLELAPATTRIVLDLCAAGAAPPAGLTAYAAPLWDRVCEAA